MNQIKTTIIVNFCQIKKDKIAFAILSFVYEIKSQL